MKGCIGKLFSIVTCKFDFEFDKRCGVDWLFVYDRETLQLSRPAAIITSYTILTLMIYDCKQTVRKFTTKKSLTSQFYCNTDLLLQLKAPE